MLEILERFEILIYRRRFGKGFRPHFSLRINGVDFHIDSSPGRGFNLITHAHTDHHGLKNMKNRKAVASKETALIVEAVSGERFKGITFDVWETIKVGGLKIKTFETKHMHGSTAFYFNGVLITGDVKDFSSLPKCDLLITEATYGHPTYVFEDEIERVIKAAKDGWELGAYPIGKAQRVAELLNENDIGFRTTEKIERICRVLDIDFQEGDARLLPTKEVRNGFILSAQRFYRNRIVLSDHIDYRGIIEMISHCDPDYVLFYHGKADRRLIEEIKKMGVTPLTLDDIDIRL